MFTANKLYLSILIILASCLLAGCYMKGQVMDGDGMVNSYRQISQEEAAKMIDLDDDHIIVDVRRQDEYDAGHIPGAILIPNESITTEPPKELPDLNQIILIYCRSGNRSKQAAQKLFDMGYTNIYEFGGINTWKGDIVTTAASDTANIWTASDIPISIRYDRMWEYSAYAESTDPELISALTEAIKALKIGEQTDMATEDYTDIVTFTFKDGSTLRYEFEDQNIVKEDGKRYQVDGLSSLRSILNNMIEEE